MKTHNLHPIWRNQPLILTTAQTTNPTLVFTDFFQSYHLNDARETLWQWVTEVVSSPNSHANDHHERNNHLFFYEKIESLVEAAWVMMRGNSQQSKPENKAPAKSIRQSEAEESKVTHSIHFSKPPRLIEKVAFQPIEVITEVFDQVTLCDLTEDLLPNWLLVVLINTQSPYSDGNGLKTLYGFYEELLPLVEALYVISGESHKMKSTFLTGVQQQNPLETINQFFQQFSIDYIRRELCDFLEAGIGYDRAYPNGFSPWQAWMTYDHILCLVEASYQLYINQQMHSVTKVLSLEWEVVG